MDYERTMKRYAQEIQRTNRKIEMYLGLNNSHQNSAYLSTQLSQSNNSGPSPQTPHKTPNLAYNPKAKLQQLPRQNAVNLLLAEYPDSLSSYHKNSKESLVSGDNSFERLRVPEMLPSVQVASVQQGNPPAAYGGPSYPYPVSYQQSLVRQAQLSKLLKHKQSMANRLEDVGYVARSIEEFPYGTEHARIMQKIMNKQEYDERRAEVVLARFQKEAEQFKREKSRAARVVYHQRNSMHSRRLPVPEINITDQTRFIEPSIEPSVRDIPSRTIADEDEPYTNKMMEDVLSVSQLTVKQNLNPHSNARQPVGVIPSAAKFKQPVHLPVSIRPSLRNPLVQQPPIQPMQPSIISRKTRRQLRSKAKVNQTLNTESKPYDDMENIRKHLELLKKKRVNKMRPASPLQQVEEMLKELNGQLKNNRSSNFDDLKKVRSFNRGKTEAAAIDS